MHIIKFPIFFFSIICLNFSFLPQAYSAKTINIMNKDCDTVHRSSVSRVKVEGGESSGSVELDIQNETVPATEAAVHINLDILNCNPKKSTIDENMKWKGNWFDHWVLIEKGKTYTFQTNKACMVRVEAENQMHTAFTATKTNFVCKKVSPNKGYQTCRCY